MTFLNHVLRSDIQEWKNRLHKASIQQFGHQLKFLIDNLKSNQLLNSILVEAMNQYQYTDEQIAELLENPSKARHIRFDNEMNRAAYCFRIISFFTHNRKEINIQFNSFFSVGQFAATKDSIIENYISPILYFLHDKLDKSSSVLYLIEKYKRRTEWFTKKELVSNYQNATKSYEQILEDNLRLFLFDQGIDYPFSTPSSPSGRADIIGSIDTDDPLVLEIKIFDSSKSYGKDRIRVGMNQIIKYTNDYNKESGFLVVFNMDEVELIVESDKETSLFPPTIIYNNKTYYIIIINCASSEIASKAKIKTVKIKRDEIIKT